MTSRHATVTSISLCVLLSSLAATLLSGAAAAQASPAEPDFTATAEAVVRELAARHGEGEAERILRGVDQVRRYWRAEDGDAETFERFILDEFLPRGESLDATFDEFTRIGIDANLSGNEKQAAELNSLGVGPNGRRRFVRRNNFFHLEVLLDYLIGVLKGWSESNASVFGVPSPSPGSAGRRRVFCHLLQNNPRVHNAEAIFMDDDRVQIHLLDIGVGLDDFRTQH